MTGKIKVLFLCTANACRSQVAEAFLRKYDGEDLEAYSAGLDPKGIHARGLGQYARQNSLTCPVFSRLAKVLCTFWLPMTMA
ncbi:MAG: hypothetical protein JW850_13005 [Thermoflexales bacterium]|nr:hypothetical protein [Thermoflexales bacterium]